MSRLLKILLVIGVIIGIAAFAILNKPANMLIRDVLGRLQNLTVVDSSDLADIKAENNLFKDSIAILERQQAVSDAITDSLRVRAVKAEKASEKLLKQLSEVEIIIPDTTEPLKYFDDHTSGQKPSVVVEGLARVEPGRIQDANLCFAKLEYHQRRQEIQDRLLRSKDDQIHKLQSIVGELETAQMNYLYRLDLKRRQINNWEQAEKELIETANKRARVAYGAGVVAILLSILL